MRIFTCFTTSGKTRDINICIMVMFINEFTILLEELIISGII